MLGTDLKQIRVSYAGRFYNRNELEKRLRIKGPGLIERASDSFVMLNRDRPFYPNPGLNYFKSRVFVSHPENVLSLVSGELKSRRTEKGVTKSVFESEGLKDLSMVFGRFELRDTVDTPIPINLYAAKDLNFNDYFRPGEVKELFEFLLRHYPALPIKELNLLFNRGTDYGGISHPGLVNFNVVQTLIKDDSSILRRVRSDSPVVFHEINKDNLIHELSHQWWGGVISWKTYQDQWITEGLAQFSTLFYLQKSVPEKVYVKILDQARSWVLRKADVGPMVYGQRILNLVDDFDAFQSIVYNKGALLFMMFKEMLGEEAFLARIKNLVENYRYQSISSALFIKIMSQGDSFHERFFNRWVHSRLIPRVTYVVSREGERVKIRFRQAETDFIFPLQVRVRTATGTTMKTVIIGETDQTVEFTADGPVRAVTVETRCSPVRLGKE
jgi:aminopeptidase N